ncbi:MAG: DegT/DnrJ/EryC1/StrS family aminotransferase [Actinomycetota bacterium]|nr:DegT/DnrJ/EryC1/StrS family aminotransferase [Actinomycetota bacterium]
MSAAPRWLVPLSDLVVDEEIEAAAREAVTSGWWSMGPRVNAFEQAFADFCEARHAIAVCSGTAALHLALLACECGPGDEVILPSLNFVAAANTVGHTGATPVFCDIRGVHDLNLDPADVEAAVTSRTKALLVLHYGGFPCDLAAITEIADRHGLAVIEDAAHAPGATWRGRMCGTIGQVGCFSFFSNKNLPMGEGGMIVTDDPELAQRMRLLRSHGMTTLTWDRHRGHAHTYDVVEQGFNYRLDEVRAAVGLVQLRRLEAANAARAQIAARYRELLDGVEGLVVPFSNGQDTSSHHLAVVVLPEEVSRERVQEVMRERGIQTSVHYPPIHRFSAYIDGAGARRELPTTSAIAGRVLTLPLYPHMQDAQVEAVAGALLGALAPEVVSRSA